MIEKIWFETARYTGLEITIDGKDALGSGASDQGELSDDEVWAKLTAVTFGSENCAEGFELSPDTGEMKAILSASLVNAYRTAAADAIAVDLLARQDSSVLALFGTGHQAKYEALAISKVTPFFAIRSAWLPRSMMAPSSTTRISSVRMF